MRSIQNKMIVAIVLLLLSWGTAQAQQPVGAKPSLIAREALLPLSFELDGNRYLARGRDYTVGLAGGNATITAGKNHCRISLEFLGANPGKPTTSEPLPGVVNIIRGNDTRAWKLGIPTYERVTWPSVYPGIDIVYYGRGQELEFDLLVKPGADPAAIRMKVRGAHKLALDRSGSLLLGDSAQGMRLGLPQIYQETKGKKTAIPGRFVIAGDDEVAFQVDHWDHTRELVIDPTITYSTLIGSGLGTNGAYGIAVDPAGGVVITGATSAAIDFPTTNAAQPVSGGFQDAFIVKINAAGTSKVYSTLLGGSGNDVSNAVAVDSSGAAWITGYTSSSNFPTVNPVEAQNKSGSLAFVAKFTATGALEFSTYLGGPSYADGQGIAVDSAGSAYAVGRAQGGFPTTSGAFRAAAGVVADVYVAKYNRNGGVLYSTVLGITPAGIGISVAIDSAGNAFVGGTSNFIFNAPAGGVQPTARSGTDAFIAKVNSSGSALLNFTFLGNTGADSLSGIALDPTSNVFIAGTTSSTGMATPGAAQGALHGSTNGYLAKLNSTLSTLLYYTYLGGSRTDDLKALAVDSAGNAYVTGSTTSLDFPVVSPLLAAFPGNGNSLFMRSDAGTELIPLDNSLSSPVADLSINSSSGSMVAATEKGIFRSVNRGVTWTQQSDVRLIIGNQFARNALKPGTIYAFGCCTTTYRSTDDGLTWSDTGGDIPITVASAAQPDPLDANTLYVAGYGPPYLAKSTDSGATFKAAASGLPAAQIFAMAATADGALFVIVDGFGIYKSTNQAASWVAANNGLGALTYSPPYPSLAASGKAVYLVNSGRLSKTADGGATWTGMSNSVNGLYRLAASSQNPLKLVALANFNAVLQSFDGGATFNSFGPTVPGALGFAWAIIDPYEGRHYFITTTDLAAFVTKLNSSGTAFSWSTYLGGGGAFTTSDTWGFGIAIDSAGNPNVTGLTFDQTFPTTTFVPPRLTTSANPFVTRISAGGEYCSALRVIPYASGSPVVSPLQTYTELQVAAPGDCYWNVASDQPWATSGTRWSHGPDSVTIEVTPNPTAAARTATITIGSQSVTITQPPASCSYSVDQNTYLISAAGGSISVNLRAPDGCPWSVNNFHSTITLTNGSGSGTGTIVLKIPASQSTGTQTYYLGVGATQIKILQGPHIPVVTSISPVVATGPVRTLTAQFTDSSGASDFNVLNLLINTSLDGRQACYVAYVRATNTLYLVSDAGDGTYAGTVELTSSGSVGNGQCKIYGQGSSAVVSGNVLTLTLNMIFSDSFSGNRVVYLAARDSVSNTGWKTMGVYRSTTTLFSFPNPSGVSPSSGTTANPTLSVTYQDSSSTSNLQTAWMLINTALDGRSACYVAYYRPGNQVFLIPDNGDGSKAVSMVLDGSNSTINNSQCTIAAAGSGVVLSGSQMTVNLNVAFNSAYFTGPKGIWTAVSTLGGQVSPWQVLGNWQVP